ncbi:MAG: EamA family transporter [Planctomycetota bacterium]
MTRSETSGFVLGLLAVLFWSPHLLSLLHYGSGQTPMLVLHFHILLWAAVVSWGLLIVSGGVDKLSVFQRHETRFILLVLTGGYGMWLLRAFAVEQAGNPANVHILFYAGPLLLGIMSLTSSEGATLKQIGALVLGFVGAIMILARPGEGETAAGMAPAASTAGLALAGAALWAVFALLARPLVRNEPVLPTATLIWSLGSACLLVTCLSTGENILEITPRDLYTTILIGGGTITAGMGLWLKCLSEVTVAFAAPIWYLSLIPGIGLTYWLEDQWPGWLAIGGAVLILLICRSGQSRDRTDQMTLSDVIRE